MAKPAEGSAVEHVILEVPPTSVTAQREPEKQPESGIQGSLQRLTSLLLPLNHLVFYVHETWTEFLQINFLKLQRNIITYNSP